MRSRLIYMVLLLCLPMLSAAQPDRVYRSLKEVADPAQVYHLQLHGKRLRHIPAAVYGMPNLQTLDLRGNRIAYLSDSIALLTRLQRLELSRNPLMELPSAVVRLKELKELVLWSTYVTALPPEIVQLEGRLALLDLRSCPLLPDDQEAIRAQLPSVKILWDYVCNCGD